MRALIDKLKEQQNLTDEELLRLITTNTENEYLRDCADLVRRERYEDKAGFVVALTGDVMTMPGLPKVPAANNMDIDENGTITGLF